MLWLYVGFFLLLFTAVFWWIGLQVYDETLTAMLTNWSQYLGGPEKQLIEALWNWWPFIIIIAGILWLYVNAQRRRFEELVET